VARILRLESGDPSLLVVAHALDKVGLAASLCPTEQSLDPSSSSVQVPENLDWGLVALKEAFKIRFNYLGPWHVDVVDTLNNIAGIHLRLGLCCERRETRTTLKTWIIMIIIITH
jgi:hypothetical protein